METRCRTEIVCLTPEAISGLLARPVFETRVQDRFSTAGEGEGFKVTLPSLAILDLLMIHSKE